MDELNFRAVRTKLARIQGLRALFLQEANYQVRYNACHERGLTDSYLLVSGDKEIGYGSVKGQELRERDTVFEFYVIPPFRRQAPVLFRTLLTTSLVTHIECQSNDPLLSAMLFEFATGITSDVVLFKHGAQTAMQVPGALVRRRRRSDGVFEHEVEPVGDYVLDMGGEVVGTGGFLLHYNPPFADVYMEVSAKHHRRGFGSYLVQEVIRECFLAGRIPAARCDVRNFASRATLTKAGMEVAGFMLFGQVKTTQPE